MTEANCSARCPVESTTRSIPAPAIRSSKYVRNGRPATGASTLGRSATTDRRRVPIPPAKTSAANSIDVVPLAARASPHLHALFVEREITERRAHLLQYAPNLVLFIGRAIERHVS